MFTNREGKKEDKTESEREREMRMRA